MREGRSEDDPTYSVVTSRSFHTGGVNATNVDGSTRFVSDNVNLEVWQGLATRNGRENVSE